MPEEPVLAPGLVATRENVLSHVQPVGGRPLTFATRGIGRPGDLTLVPLHRIVDENYTVYFRLHDEAGWQKHFADAGPKEARRKAAEGCIVDAVWSGTPRSEAAHGIEAKSAPLVSSRMSLFRDATQGSVGWRMKTVFGEPMTLRIGYVDAATVAFDVLIDGQKLLEQRPPAAPAGSSNGRTVTTIQTYAVPAALTAGKPVVEIRCAGRAAEPKLKAADPLKTVAPSAHGQRGDPAESPGSR